jgi:hypothetical protein
MSNKALDVETLARIRRRCNAASDGPWKSFVEGRDHTSGSNFIMIGGVDNRGEDIELIGAKIEDQDFIANARQDIPLLIDEIERLKEIIG